MYGKTKSKLGFSKRFYANRQVMVIMNFLNSILPRLKSALLSLNTFVLLLLENVGIIQTQNPKPIIQFVTDVGSYLRTFPFVWNKRTERFERISPANHHLFRINVVLDCVFKICRTTYFFYNWRHHQLDMTRIMLHFYIFFTSILCYAPLLTYRLREDQVRHATNEVLRMERRFKEKLGSDSSFLLQQLERYSKVILWGIYFAGVNIVLDVFMHPESAHIIYPTLDIENKPLLWLIVFSEAFFHVNSCSSLLFGTFVIMKYISVHTMWMKSVLETGQREQQQQQHLPNSWSHWKSWRITHEHIRVYKQFSLVNTQIRRAIENWNDISVVFCLLAADVTLAFILIKLRNDLAPLEYSFAVLVGWVLISAQSLLLNFVGNLHKTSVELLRVGKLHLKATTSKHGHAGSRLRREWACLRPVYISIGSFFYFKKLTIIRALDLIVQYTITALVSVKTPSVIVMQIHEAIVESAAARLAGVQIQKTE